jgi:acetylornithine deacetylase
MNFDPEMWEIEPSKLEQAPGFGVMADRDLSDLPVVLGKLKGAGKGKSLILNGHYDVVSPGELENWHHDPFEGVIEDNRIYGRGACDMKGGIAAMIKAVEFIQRAGVTLNGDITMESVPDEEGSLMGTLACCQKGVKADAAIIPEPTDFNTLVAMRGYLAGKITVLGRAGHAEITQPHWKEGGAVNAISKAVRIIQALEDLTEEWRTRPDTQHRLLDPNHIVPTVIHGGKWAISYPGKVEIQFTSNFIPRTEYIQKEIEERIMRVAAIDPWLKENPPSLETFWAYGAEIDEDASIAQTAMEVAGELGVESKPVGLGSLTDAVHLINYSRIPTISIGTAGQTAHGANEFVDIDELTALTKILALTILRWCEHS